jgi:hypothetical protein
MHRGLCLLLANTTTSSQKLLFDSKAFAICFVCHKYLKGSVQEQQYEKHIEAAPHAKSELNSKLAKANSSKHLVANYERTSKKHTDHR